MASLVIADDSLILRKTLRKIVEESGHKVLEEAEDGIEAIAAYQKFNPDIITLDFNMPGCTGVEAAERIFKLNPKAKIVLVTSYSEREKVMQALHSGIRYYLVKPLSYDKVKKMLNRVLNSF